VGGPEFGFEVVVVVVWEVEEWERLREEAERDVKLEAREWNGSECDVRPAELDVLAGAVAVAVGGGGGAAHSNPPSLRRDIRRPLLFRPSMV
jgi:hypothetical protein